MKKLRPSSISKHGLLILTLLMAVQLSSQDMDIEKLKELGRDSIISLATEKLEFRLKDHKHSGFNINIYDQVRVWAGEDILVVEFHISKVFIPRNTSFNTHVSYGFKNETVSYTQQENGSDAYSFYSPQSYPEEFKKLVPELDWEMDPELDERLLVVEYAEKLEVEHITRYVVHNYTVMKSDGSIVDEFSAELDNSWDTLVEIK